jgi:hypothetical protein
MVNSKRSGCYSEISKCERMNENFNVFDFELSADDMAAIKSLDKGSGLIIVFKTRFENLTTTITNSTTFYRTAIKNFVIEK